MKTSSFGGSAFKKNSSGIAVWGLVLALVLTSTGCNEKKDPEVEQLKSKVADLEKRLDKIEAPLLAKAQLEERQKSLHEAANHRFQLDQKNYNAQQMVQIESLYQQVSKTRAGSPERVAAVNKLTDQFPDANRTGCAMLYVAQGATGAEAEKYFQACIQKYGSCFYGDGVQVGAYARYGLAEYYKKNQQLDKAEALRNEIKEQFPDSVDHSGKLLVDLMQ